MSRPLTDIQNEYSNICLKAGNLQYELICKEGDLKLLNDRLKELNAEYIGAKNAEDAAAKAAEAAAPVAVTE